MTEKMRVGVLERPGVIEIQEKTLRNLNENEVLVQQQTCNICTTDYTQFNGLRNHQGFPMAGGHEGAGVVMQIGKNVTNVKIGDHVAVMCNSCNECEECIAGHEGLCLQNDLSKTVNEYGYYGSMGFADNVILKASRLIKIDKSIPFAEAGFLEPLATVVKGYKLLDVMPGETIVIIGGGTMGLLNALFYKSIACNVIISELMENKLENCRAHGITTIDASRENPVEVIMELTDGKGADTVILAVGNSKANEQAFEMVKANYGKISFFAAVYPEPINTFSSNLIHYKRMKLIGTTGADYTDFIDASKILNSQAFSVKGILEEKHFTLDTINEAFEYASILGKYRVTVNL